MTYLAVKCKQDADLLQKDLYKLVEWEKLWQMEFHPDKCEIISITRKKNPTKYPYTLHGQLLVVIDISYDFQCVNCQQSKRQTSSENPLQSTNHSRVPMTKLMPTSENDVEAASENTRVKSSANQDGIIL